MKQFTIFNQLTAMPKRLAMVLTLLFTLGVGSMLGQTFTRISAASDLSDGDEIIFVNQAGTYACGTTQNSNNRTPVAITTSSNSYSYKSSDNVQVFIVKVNGSNYGFHNGSGYIYSASSSNNYLRTNTTASTTAPSGTAAWTLSVSNNEFTVKNASNTSYYLAFNGTSYFSQYKSGQSKPYIYKKVTSRDKGMAGNVFVTLGMFWQLHLAYDTQNTSILPDDFYPTLHKLSRESNFEGVDTINYFIRLASDTAKKDLIPFFKKWGAKITSETYAYTSKYEEETRAIQYLNDEAMRYRLNNGETIDEIIDDLDSNPYLFQEI